MRKLILCILAVILTFNLALPCFASGMQAGVYATYTNSDPNVYITPAENDEFKVTVGDNITVIVRPRTKLPDGAKLVIRCITPDENDAYQWFSDCTKTIGDNMLPFYIYFIDADGNRIIITDPVNVEITLPSGYKNPVVCSLTTDGAVKTIDSNVNNGAVSFNTDNGNYYVIVQNNTPIVNPDTGVTPEWYQWLVWNNVYNRRLFPIETSATYGGIVTPDGICRVLSGSNQTFIFTPADGYCVNDVIVDGISVGAVKSYTFNNVMMPHTLSVIFGVKVIPWNNPYIDVDETDGFYDAVKFISENELFYGVGKNNFAPKAAMTRGDFIIALGRLAGVDKEDYSVGTSAFGDVKLTKEYAPYIEWAVKTGIVSGDGEKFRPDDRVTVEQAVVMLYRYSVYMGYDMEAIGSLANYSDSDKVSDWAVTAMEWAAGNGIYGGIDGKLNPADNVTRSLAAEMLYNFELNG